MLDGGGDEEDDEGDDVDGEVGVEVADGAEVTVSVNAGFVAVVAGPWDGPSGGGGGAISSPGLLLPVLPNLSGIAWRATSGRFVCSTAK